jgi:hypothetical protein
MRECDKGVYLALADANTTLNKVRNSLRSNPNIAEWLIDEYFKNNN